MVSVKLWCLLEFLLIFYIFIFLGLWRLSISIESWNRLRYGFGLLFSLIDLILKRLFNFIYYFRDLVLRFSYKRSAFNRSRLLKRLIFNFSKFLLYFLCFLRNSLFNRIHIRSHNSWWRFVYIPTFICLLCNNITDLGWIRTGLSNLLWLIQVSLRRITTCTWKITCWHFDYLWLIVKILLQRVFIYFYSDY